MQKTERKFFCGNKKLRRGNYKNAADTLGMPYVTNRWIGGTLTNFTEIKRRVDILVDLKEKKSKGLLEKYTKEKEQSDFSRQINKWKDILVALSEWIKNQMHFSLLTSEKK
ncbi:MAG: 30S ribosomal protein S2 [Candidatus Paceibacterota bacterium]